MGEAKSKPRPDKRAKAVEQAPTWEKAVKQARHHIAILRALDRRRVCEIDEAKRQVLFWQRYAANPVWRCGIPGNGLKYIVIQGGDGRPQVARHNAATGWVLHNGEPVSSFNGKLWMPVPQTP